MAPRKSGRRRHIPQRTCVGCRLVNDKRSMVRIVRGQDGITIDPTGKFPGRGAYVHDDPQCWKKALAGSLSNALRKELTEEEYDELSAYMIGLINEQLD